MRTVKGEMKGLGEFDVGLRMTLENDGALEITDDLISARARARSSSAFLFSFTESRNRGFF